MISDPNLMCGLYLSFSSCLSLSNVLHSFSFNVTSNDYVLFKYFSVSLFDTFFFGLFSLDIDIFEKNSKPAVTAICISRITASELDIFKQ